MRRHSNEALRDSPLAARSVLATFHGEGSRARVFVKGAPDVVLGRCASLLDAREQRTLDDRLRTAIARESDVLASEGLRVLAVAWWG